jgi:hypothetical protein
MFPSSAGIKGLLLCGLIVGASSCTVIGYGIGRWDDRKNVVVTEESPGRAVERIDQGDSITLRLRGGELLRGTYAGVHSPGASELKAGLPRRPIEECEERLFIRPGDELLLEREGRGPEQVYYVSAEHNRLLYTDSVRTTVRPLLFEHISRLTRCGGISVAKPYSDRVTDGTFGTMTMLQLLTDDGVRGVDTTAIEAVLFDEVPIGSRLLGLALGCLLDIYVYFEAQKIRFM